jgi:glycosyltransferase involved in cell wall biosynthesis
MHWPKLCAAVIPCFNEAASIASVVASTRRILPSVVVVDDGSTDQTAKLAQSAGALVIGHPGNLGKGAAIHLGLLHAHKKGFIWALLLDGDGQHAAEDLPKFFHSAETTGARLVIGDRMSQPGPMPPLRRFINRWMSRRLSRRARQMLPDTQCGFRLVHLPSWAKLSLETRRFEVESEMLLAFIERGLPVEFVPIQVIYNHSSSKIRPLADTIRWFRWWLSRPPSKTQPVPLGFLEQQSR